MCGVFYRANPERLAQKKQTTCSRRCSYTFRGSNLSNTIMGTCAVCGTAVERSPSQIKSKAGVVLCSRKCHYDARGLGIVTRIVSTPYDVPIGTREAQAGRMRRVNAARAEAGTYSPTEEVRQKISVGVARAISEGRIPRVSQLEKDVGEVLRKLGVKALPQHALRHADGTFGAVLDFFLPGSDTAVEVNGTFWHADPRVFPDGPTHASQVRSAEKYARKKVLIEERGLRLVEVWEGDFRTDPKGSILRALSG